MKRSKVILGIDPGLATTGFAVIHDLEILDFGVITTEKTLALSERLCLIEKDISDLIAKHHPDEVYLEELFFGANTKTAITVAHARGVIMMSCAKAGIPVHTVTPNAVKSAVTGDGKADKRQVQDMVRRHFSLRSIPKPDDAADALAVAYYGFSFCHFE